MEVGNPQDDDITVKRLSREFFLLRRIKPVGLGWTNNPFYLNPQFSDSLIVDGDWGYSDGRSGFGNHAFARLGSYIYDATLKVDTDNDPDYGPPHTETWILGETWTNYKSKVVDSYPAIQTGDYVQYDDWVAE